MKTKIYNLIILDRSGSMETIRTQAIDGYNETLGTIKAAQLKHLDTQEHFVSLAAFCECGIDMIYDLVPAKDAERLTAKKYSPCCSTPLYDAIGSTVSRLSKAVADDKDSTVLVTVITDGYENASKEWTCKSVAHLIDEKKEQGWMFSFIGAFDNVVEEAMSISVTNVIRWDKTEEGTKKMIDDDNRARTRYFDRVNALCCTGSPEEIRRNKKKIAEEYYE